MEKSGELLSMVTCFLKYHEYEIENMRVNGYPLHKGGRQYLDETMTGVTFTTNDIRSNIVGFILIFDTDYNSEAVVQKTTWGECTRTMYNRLYQEIYCNANIVAPQNFMVSTVKYGDLLVELQHTGGMDFIMVSMEGMY